MVTNGLPNDVLSNLDPLALIILIPICDVFVYPALRRAGIRFTPLKRITAGFITGAMAMAWAAVVQHYIYKVCFFRYFIPGVTDKPRRKTHVHSSFFS